MKKVFALGLISILFAGCSAYQTAAPTSSPAAADSNMMMSPEPTPNPAQQTQAANTISIQNYAFSPDPITVKAGAKVTVTNLDGMNHTVTAKDGSFDTGMIGQNQTKTFTAPTKPGTYAFSCTVHPNMSGTLVVQ